jgi:nucleotide-binding universal stress UspA family protein
MQIRKILAPTDFSEYGAIGVEYAVDLAKHFQADLVLIHVVGEEVFTVMGEGATALPIDQMVEDRRSEMGEFVSRVVRPRLGSQGVVKQIVVLGSPFAKIIATAESEAADLIVMSTHGRTGLSHLLIGSVTEKVIRKAACPVLSVRPAEHRSGLR